MASPDKQALDRRAFARAPLGTRAVITTGRGEVAANVVDISVAGLRLEVATPLHRGEFVRIRMPLCPEEDGCWIDPDALVVRSEPDLVTGGSKVGLSFVDLPSTTLRMLSKRVAKSLGEERASNDAPLAHAPAAPAADPRASRTRDHKPTPASQEPSPPPRPAAGADSEQIGLEPMPHPAPADSEAPKPTSFGRLLARLFGRRRAPDPPPEPPAEPPTAAPEAPLSRAELRDLFRSAVADVDGPRKP